MSTVISFKDGTNKVCLNDFDFLYEVIGEKLGSDCQALLNSIVTYYETAYANLKDDYNILDDSYSRLEKTYQHVCNRLERIKQILYREED